MVSSKQPSTSKNLEYIRFLPPDSRTTTESSLFTVTIFSFPSSLPKTFHFITTSFLSLILSEHPIVSNRGKLMIMEPEGNTLPISLLKAIDEANRTINALVMANKDSSHTLLNVVGRLENVTSTLTDRLSVMNALMKANRDANDTYLYSVSKMVEACEKAALDTQLAAMTAKKAFGTLKSVAAAENQGFWSKLKDKKWEKLFDLMVDVVVAGAVGIMVAVWVKNWLEKKD